MPFNDDLKLILSFEGGYSNDPDDSGGETNKGITKATYDAFRIANKLPTQSVKEISGDEVSKIYYGYYTDCGADKIVLYNPKLATEVFDFAINSGSGQAIRTLQRVLGVNIDGIIGSNTLSRIQNNFQSNLAQSYALARVSFYYKLCLQKPNNKKFLMSWLSRPLYIEGM